MSTDAELLVYAIRSPHGIAWDSPRALMLSTLRNQVSLVRDRRKLGHVAVELRAPTGSFLTGMTQVSAHAHRNKVFFRGRGLGVVFDTIEGRLENGDALRPELLRHAASGRLRYIKVRVTADIARRLSTFLEAFRARGSDKFYGGPNRPRHGEGGGCSAFGMSFLSLAGALAEEMDRHFLMRVRMPRGLIGEVPKGKVSLWTIFRSPLGLRWAYPDEDGAPLDIYDPDAMYAWIDRSRGRISRAQTLTLTAPNGFAPTLALDSEGDALGLVIDARKAPAATEPIWLD